MLDVPAEGRGMAISESVQPCRGGERMPEKMTPQMAWYWRRKAQGLCVSCGKPSGGMTRCEACRVRQAAVNRNSYLQKKKTMTEAEREKKRIYMRNYMNARYKARRAAGVCTKCGAQVDDGKTLCIACRLKSSEWSRAHYVRRSPAPDQRERRKAYLRDYYRNLYSFRKARGLCVICGEPVDGNYVRCSFCNKKAAAYQREKYAKSGGAG
jgi:predicted amidophosphoribosyltransferase